jgi:hypothetical protein
MRKPRWGFYAQAALRLRCASRAGASMRKPRWGFYAQAALGLLCASRAAASMREPRRGLEAGRGYGPGGQGIDCSYPTGTAAPPPAPQGGHEPSGSAGTSPATVVTGRPIAAAGGPTTPGTAPGAMTGAAIIGAGTTPGAG